eukprot:2767196-Rhodomonas_salina.1
MLCEAWSPTLSLSPLLLSPHPPLPLLSPLLTPPTSLPVTPLQLLASSFQNCADRDRTGADRDCTGADRDEGSLSTGPRQAHPSTPLFPLAINPGWRWPTLCV